MNVPSVTIDLLKNVYKKNLSVLNSQNSDLLEKSDEFTKLYQNYWISNERLKNIIEAIDILNSKSDDCI